MGSPECQAEGVGLCLLTLFLASFIMDSKASKLLSVWTQPPRATPGQGGWLGGDRLAPVLAQSCQRRLLSLILSDAKSYHDFGSKAPSTWPEDRLWAKCCTKTLPVLHLPQLGSWLEANLGFGSLPPQPRSAPNLCPLQDLYTEVLKCQVLT